MRPSKIRVIPNCVSSEFIAAPKLPPSTNPRVLIVGTTPNKNLHRTAKAFRNLSINLVILGQLKDSQRALLSEYNLKFEEVYGLGRKEVVELYQGCDLVSFVSTYEGFGMPIIEAQAVGRAVLTSDIAPMNEVAGDGALLVDPFDVGAIRAGIIQLIGNAELQRNLVRKGFVNVRRFSPKSVAKKYAEVYKELLSE